MNWSMLSILSIFLFLAISNAQNPCSGTYDTVTDVRRSTAYNETTDLCDRRFIKDGTWYRFVSAVGNKMPETNPGNRRCGTYAPIWLNGHHPTVDGVVTDVTACAVMPWLDPVCGIAYNIKVVKCGNFFLYRLKPPKQCSVAYCAGSKLLGHCSSNGTSLPVCPGIVPFIKKVEISPKDGTEEFVALKCSWIYDKNGEIVQFHVQWFRHFGDLSPTVEDMFNGTAERNYFSFFEHENRKKAGSGYLWNKKAFCKVRARFHDGIWSKWKSSKRLFTGIAVHPNIVFMKDCTNDQKANKEVYVSLRPHIPIRRKPYIIEMAFSGNDDQEGRVCVRGKIPTGSELCVAELTPEHSIDSPLWIRVIASCNRRPADLATRAVNLTFYAGNFLSERSNHFWHDYQFPEIKIYVATEQKKTCFSTTDPNIGTFDGRYYFLMNSGTFRLYSNIYTGTEVQTRQISCSIWASCNCGVAIKEGLFYKVYDMCSDMSSLYPHLSIGESSLPDSPQDGFYTQEQNYGSGKRYNVHLPSGIVVTVYRRIRFLNIEILAPIPYVGNSAPNEKFSKGLCGNFNGVDSDDFDGLTQEEFAQRHSIGHNDTVRNIFHYKGNKIAEQMLQQSCRSDWVCVCEKTTGTHECSNDTNSEAVNLCSPPEIGTFVGDLCYGGRLNPVNRRKRAVDFADDDVDDFDEILPFDPPTFNYTVFGWPTPSGLTKDNVTDICNRRIKYSNAGGRCETVEGVNMDALINQCVSDIQATDNVAWALENFGVMEGTCKKNIYRNVSFFKNSTDGKLKLETDVLDLLCPNDCSDHGTCFNSTCTCFEDYTASDCSISLKEIPTLLGIRKSGLCDVRRRPCRNVGIYAFPLLDSENLTCHVQEIKVIESVWKPSNTVSLYPGLLKDITEVKCSLPESPVNFGDYGSEGVTAAGLEIAVSNNRINASIDTMLFITYDSVCQECNATTRKCTLKTDACFIFGHCFSRNESHPYDWCRQCLPHVSTTSWEKRRDNQKPKFTTSNVFYAFRGKQLRVQLRAIDPEYRSHRYSFAQTETLGASLTESGFFTWIKNTNDSTIFKFNVTDECGAHSILNASVVIKECPCKNSGECLPDYRYLNGEGKFTCSCPIHYMGRLCDVDVNECVLLKPCFNGSCNNEQPGFSCSCFAGYTGELCQMEINECASSPCFSGVPCTDMVASFNCGPCPSEYTGNGVNCTRKDGKMECLENPQICHSNANCFHINGSYICQCKNGFTGDGERNCTDVDECMKIPGFCHQNANCINTEGNFSCACLKGYAGDGQRNCSDIDECASLSNVCSKNAQCLNTGGSYLCQCGTGYSGDGYSNCTDIDECMQSPSVCLQNATCTNTEGDYSCTCLNGYTGDGQRTCSENQPPMVTTPNTVYAILNNDFKIQIKAEDPEGQNMIFTLLSNGSLTNVQFTKQRLLIISNIEQNGTVYVQVEDEIGAKTIFILRVNVFKCPCMHYGKCYQKKDIVNPLQPSDYLCQCENAYKGDRCEIAPNPCDEQPCYPGLKCSSSQNSEGSACADCPPLFEGDGKNCELKPTEESSLVESEMTLTNQKWDDQLKTKTSKMYKNLVTYLTVEIKNIYKDHPHFSYVIITGFRDGSIIVEFKLIFMKKVENPLRPLAEATKTGMLGNMTVTMANKKDANPSDGKILGLDKTIFYVTVGAAAALILMVGFAIYLFTKRYRAHREVNIGSKILDANNKQVQGAAFRSGSGGGHEEIDLKVFDNEAINLDEEIKLQH